MKYNFIINPISGSVDKTELLKQLSAKLKALDIDFEFHYTQYKGHAVELASALNKNLNTTIVAVGGDGTVNEIGGVLLNSATPFGIIPVGSGNGLARHLKIPLQPLSALDCLLTGKSTSIDAGKLNDQLFFVTCGVGFEAEVTHNFNDRKSRGLLGYVKEALSLFRTYEAMEYSLEFESKQRKIKAFSITIANCSQYGNNAIIARDASVTDGKLDVCVLANYPKILGPKIGLSLFLKNIHKSSYYSTEQVAEATVTTMNRTTIINAHVDGEAIEINLPAKVVCIPKALNIIAK